MMKNFIIIILILLCSCCPNKQHAIIKADLVKVFDNYPLDSKGDENYTREIHLVFRITNTTNDTFFIPMQAMGYDCNSKIHFCVDSLKSISFATFYGRVASSHVLLPHDSIDCGISIYQDKIRKKNMSVQSLLKVLKVEYCVDDSERKNSKYQIPTILFDVKDKNVEYFYNSPDRHGPL
nr:hypothetical protein [uncultured Prevotella sp.]